MPIPDTLTKIRISGDVRHPLSGTPGTGTVEFEFGYAIRDTANNILFGAPTVVTAVVADGTFLTDEFVSPRQDGVTPPNQPLTVRILTDVYADTYQVEIPEDATGTLHLAQLAPAEAPPAVVSYALASQLALYLPLAGGQLSGAARWNGTPTSSGDLTPKSYVDTAITEALTAGLLPFLPRSGGTITGPITWNGTPSASGHLATKAYVDTAVAEGGGTGGGATRPDWFNVEDYGAVGDGVTDDYEAIRAAWDAMLANEDDDGNPLGGYVHFPRVRTYRVVATPERLTPTADGARALFPLPMRSRALDKVAYGVLGVGDAFVVRTADLGGEPGQVRTASVLQVDYDTPFTWDAETGLPCVIGAPDVDVTGAAESNIFSNLHFSVDELIIRQPDNPSLCAVNLEQASTVRIGALRIDVAPVLDLASEPTHPTSGALLLPRSNNNVAVLVDRLIVEGHYAGAPLTEHGHLRDVIALRCKIAVHTRRPNSHHGEADSLKIEQCPNWISGWDPTAEGPDGGVVAVHGWTGYLRKVAGEDYAYNGAREWLYAPVSGVHINDPDGVLSGTIAYFTRVNSEPPAPTGIGIGSGGSSSTLYVRGPGGTTASPIAIYGINHTAAATRMLPPGDVAPVEHRLFPAVTGDEPSASATDGSAITLGTRIDITAPCQATKLHFWRAATDITGTITGRIYRMSDQAVVAGPATFTLSGTGWQTADLPEPVDLEDGERYIVAITYPDRYPFTGSYWDSGAGGGGIIAGPLTAYSTHDSAGGQGAFASGTAYPAGNGNGANYWADITVQVAA
jgi:hypothetical protein